MMPNTFEPYNWPTVVIQLVYYILMITGWLTIIDLINIEPTETDQINNG
jgi:ABC-2 type transport system permease protein